jgi:hypothetical protein
VTTRSGIAVLASAARTDTGPDAGVRAMVLERDGYRCVCCGRSVTGEPFMLVRRLRGGGDSPANLITTLGTPTSGCAGRIDSRRDPDDEAKGYSVGSGQDPAEVPVVLFGGDGPGVPLFLSAEGFYHAEPQATRP